MQQPTVVLPKFWTFELVLGEIPGRKGFFEPTVLSLLPLPQGNQLQLLFHSTVPVESFFYGYQHGRGTYQYDLLLLSESVKYPVQISVKIVSKFGVTRPCLSPSLAGENQTEIGYLTPLPLICVTEG